MVERFASYIVGLLYRPADCHPILFLGCSRVDCARAALKVHIFYILLSKHQLIGASLLLLTVHIVSAKVI